MEKVFKSMRFRVHIRCSNCLLMKYMPFTEFKEAKIVSVLGGLIEKFGPESFICGVVEMAYWIEGLSVNFFEIRATFHDFSLK